MIEVMTEKSEKHYINLSNVRIDKGFDIIDEAMGKVFNELHLNMYEATTILDMLRNKIQRNNIDQYLLETCTRFQERMNEEDEKGR